MKRTPLKRKTRLKPRSDKRAAYMRSDERRDGLAHMARVAQLPCLVCGAWPVEVHHMPHPRSDFRVVPLCPFHHRREYGEQAYHFSRRNFNARHGSDDDLLARVAEMLSRGDV